MKVSNDFIVGSFITVFMLTFVVIIAIFMIKNSSDDAKTNDSIVENSSSSNNSNAKVMGKSTLNDYEGEFGSDSKTTTYPAPIRKPQVAGSFYPADKNELERELENTFNGVKNEPATDLKIAIAPHAGLRFSGKVGAEVY